jgi:Ni/Fe-hydrogenase 1 B-type cytochrome subunit
MDTARYIHFIFMYMIGWVFVYKLYYTIATGEIKELIFKWSDLKDIPALFKYYLYDIFVGNPKPEHWGKYNPGQKMVYTLWPILLVAQGITGLAMYFTARFVHFNNFFGGLANIRAWHFIIMWVFIVTTVLHFYLGSTGPKIIDYYKSVVTGYEKQAKK